MKDAELIALVRSRDEGAIAWIIDRYSRLLWRVTAPVLASVGSERDMEEVVADAFIALWEHPEKFDPARGSLKTWLCMTARSRARDRARRLMRLSAESLDELLAAGDISAEPTADDHPALIAAVDALPEPDREILIRRYCYEQKPRQIAAAMSLNVKEVDNRLYRTRRKLRQRLEKEEEL